jgi:hypothetical protein
MPSGWRLLIAIIGEGAEALEEEVDWLVIGDGADKSRFLVTSAHPEESLEDVLEFALNGTANARAFRSSPLA